MPFSKGDPNINRKGRIDGGGGLKAYDRAKFKAMSEEEKEEFLKTIAPDMRYRMAEGNPQSDITSGGEPLIPDKEAREQANKRVFSFLHGKRDPKDTEQGES